MHPRVPGKDWAALAAGARSGEPASYGAPNPGKPFSVSAERDGAELMIIVLVEGLTGRADRRQAA